MTSDAARMSHATLGVFVLVGALVTGEIPAGAAASGAGAGGYQRPGATELVSVAPGGTPADGQSSGVDVSADGRFVAFDSYASNLVPADTNGSSDVFVRDRESGTTELVSVAPYGAEFSSAGGASISSDGRLVAFRACLGPTCLTSQVYVRDRQSGTTEMVSVSSEGVPAALGASQSAISADGRFVAFGSSSPNLVVGDTNAAPRSTEVPQGTCAKPTSFVLFCSVQAGSDIFVHDRETGTTERVSVASDGSQGQGRVGALCYSDLAISADGRFVAFTCDYDNLVADDTNGGPHVFVRDRQTGTTELVSVRGDGSPASRVSEVNTDVSADGRFVTFGANDALITPTSTSTSSSSSNVYVRDRQTATTERVSVRSDGREDPGALHSGASITPDGRYVAYTGCLNPGAVGAWHCIASVRDRATGTTERVSVATGSTEGNRDDIISPVALSHDARYVAFLSRSTNLVAGDTNDTVDAFVRDRGAATGVGGLTVQEGGGQYSATGWATFAGATVASAEDSATDGDDAVGAEITAASVIHRPELADLLVRLDLAVLPVTEYISSHTCDVNLDGVADEACTESFGGTPDTLYRLRFDLGQTTYEVRALPADPNTPFRAALYRCAPNCTESGTLTGAVGTTGPQVRVSLPLAAVGIDGAADLTQVEASVIPPGSSAPIDTLALPGAHIEPPQVKLGIAAPSTPEDEIPFTTTAGLTDGRFSATLSMPAAPGSQQLWARACLGDVCGYRSVDL